MSVAKKAGTGCLTAVILFIGVIIIWYQTSFPTASYRFRLSIMIETNGQVHSSSSVIAVSYRFFPKWAAGMSNGVQFERTVRGQAVVIDVGERGALVAALTGPPEDTGVQPAEFIAARAFLPYTQPGTLGFPASLENIEAISRAQGAAELQPNNMPAFLWFSDKADPTTATFVKPSNFASVLGDSARLVSAKVEITQDPIVIDIDKELPLYKKLPQPPGLILSVTDRLIVNWTMFIAPGST